jgi:hypothetical protein
VANKFGECSSKADTVPKQARCLNKLLQNKIITDDARRKRFKVSLIFSLDVEINITYFLRIQKMNTYLSLLSVSRIRTFCGFQNLPLQSGQNNIQILKKVLGPPKEIDFVCEKCKRGVKDFAEIKIFVFLCFPLCLNSLSWLHNPVLVDLPISVFDC